MVDGRALKYPYVHLFIMQSWRGASMAFSDEEGEIGPECVTNYYFINHREEPVSFSVLPQKWKWNGGEFLGERETQVFLLGTDDDGLRKIYKRVIAWKFELSYVQPEISMLSKDRSWIKT